MDVCNAIRHGFSVDKQSRSGSKAHPLMHFMPLLQACTCQSTNDNPSYICHFNYDS